MPAIPSSPPTPIGPELLIPFLIGELAAGHEQSDLRLGPLSFVHPVGPVSEAVGDGLEAVGDTLVSAERRPRSVGLKLPVRGTSYADPKPEGVLLRRQLRQLLNNAKFRQQGFFLYWTIDEDMDSWLLVGGGTVSETDPGISFGEFELELSEVFLRGRPSTHRPGRRAVIRDRRGGAVERDTRGLLYSTDFGTVELPECPLIIPGDVRNEKRSSDQTVNFQDGLEDEEGKIIWQGQAVEDGEVVSYEPRDEARDAYLVLDERGSVRVWDASNDPSYPRATGEYTLQGDRDAAHYAWERVYGELPHPRTPVAIDNGVCRIVWLEGSGVLSIERWVDGEGYEQVGKITGLAGCAASVIELTLERTVVEFGNGERQWRVILQRGWSGPRLENYTTLSRLPSLVYEPTATGTLKDTLATAPYAFVHEIKGNTGATNLLWAQGSADETFTISGGHITIKRAAGKRVVVAQLMVENEEQAVQAVAQQSLVDAQSIPVLVAR